MFALYMSICRHIDVKIMNLSITQGHGNSLGSATIVTKKIINLEILGNGSNLDTISDSSTSMHCSSCCRMIPGRNMALHGLHCEVRFSGQSYHAKHYIKKNITTSDDDYIMLFLFFNSSPCAFLIYLWTLRPLKSMP